MTELLQKKAYLENEAVQAFTQQLASWMDGEPFGEHHFFIRDKILPENYDRNFHATTLTEAFDRFYWNGKYYPEHQQIQDKLRLRLQTALGSLHDSLVDTIDDILLWASGGKVIKLYTLNRDWARNHASDLAVKLQESLNIFRSDTPDCSKFDGELRMNAGFTKIYALAEPSLVAYDGRTGAAMGYLTRQFCEKQRTLLDPNLCFPWAPGASTMNRNPSTELLHFKQLANRSRFHAEWKIRASWVLNAASDLARSEWCKGMVGLRRVEAALFMIGYDIPLAKQASKPGRNLLSN